MIDYWHHFDFHILFISHKSQQVAGQNRGVLPRDRETGIVETQSADYSGSAVFGFRRIACVFDFCNWMDGVYKGFRN